LWRWREPLLLRIGRAARAGLTIALRMITGLAIRRSLGRRRFCRGPSSSFSRPNFSRPSFGGASLSSMSLSLSLCLLLTQASGLRLGPDLGLLGASLLLESRLLLPFLGLQLLAPLGVSVRGHLGLLRARLFLLLK
jgi:hypothetical protein